MRIAKHQQQLQRRGGFTLIEVLMTMAIVAFSGIAIISALSFGIAMKQAIRERNGAMRIASTVLEDQKKIIFQRLQAKEESDVVIDDRGTESTADDIKAKVVLNFYDKANTKVGTESSAVPLDRSMLRAEVIVTWKPAGRRASVEQTIILQSLISP